MRSAARALARILEIAGALALAYCAFVYLQGAGFQYYEKWVFGRSLQHRASNTPAPAPAPSVPQNHAPSAENRPAPAPPPIPVGSVIAEIQIPRLKLSTMVVEGYDDVELREGAGHVPGTGLPGSLGNVAIAAHRDTFFRPLRKIAKDDEIVLVTLKGTYRYIVDSTQITTPDNVSVLKASGQPELTLITCYPFYYVGSAPQRFIVHAKQIDPVPQPARVERASYSAPAPSIATLPGEGQNSTPPPGISSATPQVGTENPADPWRELKQKAQAYAQKAETYAWKLAKGFYRLEKSAGELADRLATVLGS